ncbi:MAG: efflux system, inner rane transporter CmeB [Myxococcales bacterium]|nr:efflux system, inner rane transporter CmeB [Myxococcales bacterium]
MVDFFIRRPVLATVLALLTVLGGAISIPSLPIARYPTLAAPQVVVNAVYIGASSQIVEAAVTTPLEEAINGVEGMRYIQSSSTNDGVSTITVTFEPTRDIDIASVDVQNRVQSALPRLPLDVRNTGVTVVKSSTSIVLAVAFYADQNTYSTTFISNYVDRYVRDALLRVPGVGEARIFNPRTYAMRLWLDPDKLAARRLGAGDVVRALREQNIEIAAGQLGREPAPPGQVLQISVRAQGRLADVPAFERMVVKTGTDGTLVQVKDVGRVELGAEDYSVALRFDRRDAIGLGIFQLPTSNALDIETRCRTVLEDLARTFPPGLHYEIGFDPTAAVRESISDVVTTLMEAILIVIAVIFVFLQGWRATVIPAITIPVSLVGTFIFVKAFGFSINTLTLFGLTLATGLVVDDAIVVIENIERHLAEGATSARVAASDAMREVAGAVIATSLVLIAVFVPVSFFPGTTGRIYQQFALTIAFSIALSAFNALTLSPAIAALLLRRREGKRQAAPFRAVNRGIQWAHDRYGRMLEHVLRHTRLLVIVFLAALALTTCVYRSVPSGFVPDEDQGYLILAVQGPSGASLQETISVTKQVEAILARTPEVQHVFSVNGFSFAGAGSNRAIVFAGLAPFGQRSGEEHSAQAVLARLRGPLMGLRGAIVIPFLPPSIQGVGTFGGLQLEVEDRASGPIENLAAATFGIVGAASKDTRLRGLLATFTVDDPQELVDLDRERAKALGVTIDAIAEALQVYLGSSYVNDFDFDQRSYRVYVQADKQFRTQPRDITSFYVRSTNGALIPLEELVHVKPITSPQVVTHFNLFRAAEINGSPAPGVSTGEAMAALEAIAAQTLPAGMSIEWAGLSLEQQRAGGQVAFIFALAVLIVYLVLSAQYESFALPFIILLAVPIAILGALAMLVLRGMITDVFAQIGMVMLVGLASKNAILIVEFAEQLRHSGRSLTDAAISAAQIRLRPILMTSFAFVLGVLPLVLATGSGAGGRRSLGTTVFGGMILSTFLNLVFIPVLYVVIEGFRERRKGPSLPRAAKLSEAE